MEKQMTSVLPRSTAHLTVARQRLESDGYVVLHGRQLKFSDADREHIHRTYFTGDVLRCYDGDIPPDRERARDVIRYDWRSGALDLREYESIAIENRGDHPDRREFERIEILQDDVFARWISTALHLIPTALRQDRGTFGVNMFRTYTNVVTKPHQDGEEFVFIYVVDKIGGGGETVLYGMDSEIVLKDTLEPGEMVVFRDKQFRHTASPLTSAPDAPARRDALVCTVNYPDTYPLAMH
ncbi:2OG-Fe dioxygenase family protein [Actinokineospora sp.]|uniref:2OG-Fe dioxygenase family protein n=1 Tax=Actinokineospora sp. TaxID=1872133 RepID=UPI0040383D92